MLFEEKKKGNGGNLKNAKLNFPLTKMTLQLMLVICAVFSACSPVLQRNNQRERVCVVVVHVDKYVCMCVLHGQDPLMSIHQKRSPPVVRAGYCSLVFMPDL